MGITVYDFVNAIADKLKKLYPEYDVWIDEIKQEQILSHYFFIHIINVANNMKLGNRCERIYDFDIFYFQPENRNINFYTWTEVIMRNFKLLEVGEDLYHVRNTDFVKIDDISHFTFSVKFYTLEIEEKTLMETLILERSVKDG